MRISARWCWSGLGSIVGGSGGTLSCFTIMCLECASSLACPLTLWRHRLPNLGWSIPVVSTLSDCLPFPCGKYWGWAKIHHSLSLCVFPSEVFNHFSLFNLIFYVSFFLLLSITSRLPTLRNSLYSILMESPSLHTQISFVSPTMSSWKNPMFDPLSVTFTSTLPIILYLYSVLS